MKPFRFRKTAVFVLICSAGCMSSKGDDIASPDTGRHGGDSQDSRPLTDTDDSATSSNPSCPRYSGLNVAENPYSAVMEFLVATPPYEALDLGVDALRDPSDEDPSTFPIRVTLQSTETIFADLQFTLSVEMQGELQVRCDEQGYWELGSAFLWTLRDEFGGYEVTTTSLTTFDPPLLIVPADLAPGLSWTNASTKTIENGLGSSTTEEIVETRTAIGFDTIPWYIGDATSEALLVETSDGQQLWYVEDLGIVRGGGLNLIGGGLGED